MKTIVYKSPESLVVEYLSIVFYSVITENVSFCEEERLKMIEHEIETNPNVASKDFVERFVNSILHNYILYGIDTFVKQGKEITRKSIFEIRDNFREKNVNESDIQKFINILLLIKSKITFDFPKIDLFLKHLEKVKDKKIFDISYITEPKFQL